MLPDPDDFHRWASPEELNPPDPCPDCSCCTARLCQEADETGMRCVILATPADTDRVRGCPCGEAAFERQLERLREASSRCGLCGATITDDTPTVPLVTPWALACATHEIPPDRQPEPRSDAR